MSVTSGRKFSLLPMLGHTKGKRSPVTCALKCDNACSGEVCNTSTNSYFRDIASATMSRRAALGFGAAGALAVVLGNAVTSAGTAVADGGPGLAAAAKDGFGKSKLQFTAIAPVDAAVDQLTVPAGFTWQPVIRWGDPLFNDSPAFDLDHQSAAAQARQFGYNNDYTDILPIAGSKDRRAVLFTNHEYTNESIMLPAGFDAAEARAIGRAAHGLTVVELERANKNKPWSYVRGAGLNRRFLTDTTYELDGPAAGSALLKTAADPSGRAIQGTLGNCSGGTTPWGTILSGEENFNGYFAAPGTSDADKRYGLTSKPTARQWELDDPRFDTRNPGIPERGQPLRLDRGSGPVRSLLHAPQALRDGPLQARGRQRDRRQVRPRGGLHGRRRALRLPVQVRLGRHVPARHDGGGPQEQPDAALRG